MFTVIDSERLKSISEQLVTGDYTMLGYNCFDDAYIQHMTIVKAEIRPYGAFTESLYITYKENPESKEELLILFPFDKFLLWKDFIDLSDIKSTLMQVSRKTYFRDTPPDPEAVLRKIANREPVAVKN